MEKPGAQTDGIEPNTRGRILAAAEDLIAASGVEAATTRAVAAAAGVQAPALYRLFGDKDGLLDAVAEHAMARYVAQKAGRPSLPDPVDELRAGWDAHVEFAMAHPGIFMIMTARPLASQRSEATRQGMEVLRGKIRGVALAGRLRLAEERALDLMHACASGAILTLLGQTAARRDLALSRQARELAIAALTGEASEGAGSDEGAIANALRVRLPDIDGLTSGERLLLAELLERIAAGQKDG